MTNNQITPLVIFALLLGLVSAVSNYIVFHFFPLLSDLAHGLIVGFITVIFIGIISKTKWAKENLYNKNK